MMHKILLLLLLSAQRLLPLTLFAQALPVQEWSAASRDKPFIFYISGDGGLNTYSTDLCVALNKEGYEVVALNVRTYFWDKKTPEKIAMDINNYLSKKLAGRKTNRLYLSAILLAPMYFPLLLTGSQKTFIKTYGFLS